MDEKIIEEQKHKEFIKKESFGANLLEGKPLLRAFIVPCDISKEKVVFRAIGDWVSANRYGDYKWNHFLNGIRAMKYNEEEKYPADSIIELREDYTYGVSLEVKDKEQLDKIEKLCVEFIESTKNIIYGEN